MVGNHGEAPARALAVDPAPLAGLIGVLARLLIAIAVAGNALSGG